MNYKAIVSQSPRRRGDTFLDRLPTLRGYAGTDRVNRFARRVVLLMCMVTGMAACRPEFNPKLYPNPEDLFNAGMAEFNARRWGNAAKAFEQLSNSLPVRDSLLPLAYFYLGQAHSKNGEHLLAATSFYRLSEALPEDTLADDALYRSGVEYAKMWRKPDLDPQYGTSALNTLQTLLVLYPESPLVADAQTLIDKLNNMFARKDFNTGYSYFRRRAYDSAIIYFKDVLRLHPTSPAARDAALYLLEAYRKIKYTADARDLCEEMQKTYPNDSEVREKCGSASSAEASTPRT
jgi:outer membrane protein assembly factor BamD